MQDKLLPLNAIRWDLDQTKKNNIIFPQKMISVILGEVRWRLSVKLINITTTLSQKQVTGAENRIFRNISKHQLAAKVGRNICRCLCRRSETKHVYTTATWFPSHTVTSQTEGWGGGVWP